MNNTPLWSPHRFLSRYVTTLSATALLTSGALLFGASSLAQSKTPSARTVEGTVTDKNDKPLANAVVYLKDEKTLTVKSFLTDEQGHYRFGQLSMSNDYEVWADLGGTHSKTKHVSSFNSKPTVDYSFQIDK